MHAFPDALTEHTETSSTLCTPGTVSMCLTKRET